MDNITTFTLTPQAFYAPLHVSVTCVLLTSLPCCSRLPLKKIACVTAVKNTDLIAESLAAYRTSLFFLLSPLNAKEKEEKQQRNRYLFDFSLCRLLLFDQRFDVNVLYMCVCVCLCVCVRTLDTICSKLGKVLHYTKIMFKGKCAFNVLFCVKNW